MTYAVDPMFCVMCGAGGQQGNAYCKRCGEWLPDIKAGRRKPFGGDTPRKNLFTILFMSASSAIFALFSAIALYATYLGTNEVKWSVYFAAAFCLCIAAWQTSSFIAAIKLRKRLAKGREKIATPVLDVRKQRSELGPADTAPFIGVPSVTESTTELLEPARPVGADRKD
jgi:hypothetical protein